MPFPTSWIEDRLQVALQEKRLAHAYLLMGSSLETLEKLFENLTRNLIGHFNPDHPDLHIVRPESKSRRLTVDQIRDLEHTLQLKAHECPYKIAGIIAADRMCLGSAEPANAFLKTLEEPPNHSIIFLLTDRPDQLLPTIKSRCLSLTVADQENQTEKLLEIHQDWIHTWIGFSGAPADIAYRRAEFMAKKWRNFRDEIEKNYKQELKNDPDSVKAQIESEFLLIRDHSIAALIHHIWNNNSPLSDKAKQAQLCENLEELRYALSRNLDQNLALERCSLKMSGLIG